MAGRCRDVHPRDAHGQTPSSSSVPSHTSFPITASSSGSCLSLCSCPEGISWGCSHPTEVMPWGHPHPAEGTSWDAPVSPGPLAERAAGLSFPTLPSSCLCCIRAPSLFRPLWAELACPCGTSKMLLVPLPQAVPAQLLVPWGPLGGTKHPACSGPLKLCSPSTPIPAQGCWTACCGCAGSPWRVGDTPATLPTAPGPLNHPSSAPAASSTGPGCFLLPAGNWAPL